MKPILRTALMVIALLCTAAMARKPAPQPTQDTLPIHNPCQDSLYQALSTRPIEGLDERQLQYVLQGKAQCTQYQLDIAHIDALKQSLRDRRARIETGVIISVMATIIANLMVIVIVDPE